MPAREVSVAFQTNKPMQEYAELARLAEGYGFDVISMYNDLFFQPPIGPLIVAARATERIRIGPAALNPFTLHPVEIAGQFATLDEASGGRAYLGITRGAWLGPLGVDQHDGVGRIAEAVEIVDHLLADKQEAYRGKHFKLEPHHRLNYPVERHRAPLLIGGWGPKLLKRMAGRADEIKVGGTANPDLIPHIQARIADYGAPGIVVGAVTIVDEDADLARRMIRREMPLYLPVIADLDPSVQVDPELLARMASLVDHSEIEEAGALIPEHLIDRFSFSGSPSQIIEQCQRLFAAGVNRIEFGTPHGATTAEGMRLLGEVVLPALLGR